MPRGVKCRGRDGPKDIIDALEGVFVELSGGLKGGIVVVLSGGLKGGMMVVLSDGMEGGMMVVLSGGLKGGMTVVLSGGLDGGMLVVFSGGVEFEPRLTDASGKALNIWKAALGPTMTSPSLKLFLAGAAEERAEREKRAAVIERSILADCGRLS